MPSISNHKNKEIRNVFTSKTDNDGGEKVFSDDSNGLNMPSISNHKNTEIGKVCYKSNKQ